MMSFLVDLFHNNTNRQSSLTPFSLLPSFAYSEDLQMVCYLIVPRCNAPNDKNYADKSKDNVQYITAHISEHATKQAIRLFDD